LRPGALPHHRTCGFPHPAVERGGLNGWPQDPMALGARPRIAAEKFGSGGMLELREGQPDGARAGFAEFWAPKRHLEWLSC